MNQCVCSIRLFLLLLGILTTTISALSIPARGGGSPPGRTNTNEEIAYPIAKCAPPTHRRKIITTGGSLLLSSIFTLTARVNQAVAVTAAKVMDLEQGLSLIRQARQQLGAIPALIQNEQWDSVRAILITPPLADCWAKTSRSVLSQYATALGDAGGDEFAALELREEAKSHLRYLDMAVYNNIFNPIKTEGETGATAGLIKSYYEDPMNEWKASVKALEDLIQLEKER